MLVSSEYLSEALITASDFVIVLLSPDFRIREWNPAAENLLEYPRKEVLEKNFLEALILPEEREDVEREFLSILEGATHQNYEYPLYSRHGKKRTFLWNAQRLLSKEGRTVGILTIGKDITERIEKEVSLENSEYKLRNLIESALDGIVTIDERGIIESANPATTTLFGYTEPEMLGRNVSMLMPEPDKSSHDGYLHNYLRTGKKKIIGIGREVTGRRKDGSLFPFKLSVTEVWLGNKRTFMGMVHNLTQQKAAEKKIQEYTVQLEKEVKKRTQEIRQTNENLHREIRDRKAIEQALKDGQELYKAIARNFPDGTISVLDRELKYVFIEGKELFAMGVTSRSLIGTHLADRLPDHLKKEITGVLRNVFNDQKETMEIELKENSYILNAVPLSIEDGEVKQILVVEENITKQKKAERNMREALKKEIELNNLKSRFVSMASHEFRTPLTTILSSASLMEHYTKTEDQEKRNKHIQRIKSSVGTLTSILNDFLSLSRLEEGKLEIKPQTVNIESFCSELCEEMQGVSRKGQEIDYTHKGKEKEVLVDPQMLKNILHNLLSNAIKYSAEDQGIRLHTAIRNDTLIVEVSDEGIGIPKEDQNMLYDRFFRAKNVTNIQGTGLGLNIVQKYVELMNGTINFVSEEGKGSTFTVTFKTNAT